MTRDDDRNENVRKSARDARLKLALRENLKRRKSQARGRVGMTVVTPDDDAAENNDDTRKT